MMTPERMEQLREHANRTGEMVRTSCLKEAIEEIDRLGKELASYKRAKSENDDRFMVERDQARQEDQALRAALEKIESLSSYTWKSNKSGMSEINALATSAILAHPRGGGEGV